MLTNGSRHVHKDWQFHRQSCRPTCRTILNNPAGFYFNVHTTVNPGGAVRGQLQ